MIVAGRPWPHCPRDFLKRMIAEAGREGLEIHGAFENEFYLLRPGPNGVEPADETVFAATLAMDLNRAVMDEIAEALLAQQIPVELYYPESGPGQHELKWPTRVGRRRSANRFRATVRRQCRG